MSAYLSASADNMQTWGHNSESGSISNYWRDTKRAVSLEFAPGFVMVSNKLRRTEDGGKTWVNFGTSLDTRHFAGRIVFADANEILIQGSHRLYSTIDNGQTWRRIFPLNPP